MDSNTPALSYSSSYSSQFVNHIWLSHRCLTQGSSRRSESRYNSTGRILSSLSVLLFIIETERESISPTRSKRVRQRSERSPPNPVHSELEPRFRFEKPDKMKSKTRRGRIQRGRQTEGPKGSGFRWTFFLLGQRVPWSAFRHP